MSSDIYAKVDSSKKVRRDRETQEDTAEWQEMEVDIYESTDTIRDDHIGFQSNEGASGPQREKKHRPATQRGPFKAAACCLGVLCSLMIAAIILLSICCKLTKVYSEKEQLQIINDKLKNISDMAANHSQLLSSYKTLSENLKQLQDEVKKLKIKTEVCPDGWKRFGRSCYFKSNEKKNWSDSKKYCENNGAHLVIINNKEEQKFVSELSVDGESWIGLQREWIYGYYEWRWVDGSALTEPFWASGQHITDTRKSAVCCDQGKWTQSYYYDEKKWICEKQIS